MGQTRSERLVAAWVRRPWLVLAAAVVITAVAAVGAARLEVRTAREALMPRDVPAMQRFDAFLARFGSANDLIVALEGGADQAARDRFSAALAERLTARPEVRSAFDRISPRTLAERAWLLAPADALAQAAAWSPPESPLVDLRAAAEAARAGLEDADLPSDVDLKAAVSAVEALRWGLSEWRRWIEAPAPPSSLRWATLLGPHGAADAADGVFRSRDKRLSFLFVRPADPSGEYAALAPFVAVVRDTAEALQAEWTDAPTVGLAGLPAVAVEEFSAVQADIQLVVLTSAGLILGLVLLWLRDWRRAVAIFVPMGLGVVWNLGLVGLLVGHLTIITSSFTAILFGLGVDYGIFLSARVLTARREEPDPRTALVRGVAAAIRPLLVAGGATGLIFAALGTSDFSGFAELGVVAATGVVLVVFATLTVQPAIVAVLPMAPPPEPSKAPAASRPRRGLAIAVLALGLGGAAGGVLAGPLPFDYDVLGLLPAGSEAVALQRRMTVESDYQAEVILLSAPSVAEAEALARRVEALPTVARVQSVGAFFPADAAARAPRARALAETARRLRPWVARPPSVDAPTLAALAGLVEALGEALADGQEQAFSAGHAEVVKALEGALAEIEALQTALGRPTAGPRTAALLAHGVGLAGAGLEIVAGWAEATPPSPRSLPSVLRDRFLAADGTVAVYAWPSRSVYDPRALTELVDEVKAVAPEATGFPMTHHVFAGLVVTAYRRGTLLAAAVALLFILITLRRPAPVLLAALPLAIGGAWMNGALHLLGQPVNFANIIALPLVMGLAVDYGVWFAHQAQAHPEDTGWGVARRAGGPILLAAGTTLAGLGAITLARYQGVASMGRSITVGLLACLLAALVFAPAVTQLFFRRSR